ncbi:transcriptional regulator [Parasphingopyxis algicola]|uniref:helix-turn-helix domain-containing protein n=1 Tax=Parasphingopyxis algicola TaxID=2026624 RepID=UPI0015A42522|nr:transcriptional regulator [Parasphingopyxis algicola]
MPLHPIDIKARLKKLHGSVLAFERARGLPPESVRDVLRGRSNRRVATAIAKELDLDIHSVFPGPHESRKRDDNAGNGVAHHQNSEPRRS